MKARSIIKLTKKDNNEVYGGIDGYDGNYYGVKPKNGLTQDHIEICVAI